MSRNAKLAPRPIVALTACLFDLKPVMDSEGWVHGSAPLVCGIESSWDDQCQTNVKITAGRKLLTWMWNFVESFSFQYILRVMNLRDRVIRRARRAKSVQSGRGQPHSPAGAGLSRLPERR